jgi:hypothetical protein
MRDILLDATRLAGVGAILRDDLAHLPAAADDGLAVLLLVLDTRVAGVWVRVRVRARVRVRVRARIRVRVRDRGQG